MKFFTRREAVITILILLLISIISYGNFKIALRRERDATRKADLGNLINELGTYYQDFGFYPPSTEDGRIIACKKEGVEKPKDLLIKETDLETQLKNIFAPCDWGKDSLRDVFDTTYPAYIKTLPADPDRQMGAKYVYISDTQHFQIYTALEGKDEDEYSPAVIKRDLSCGIRTCNFGRASGSVPVDRSLEQYVKEQLNKGS